MVLGVIIIYPINLLDLSNPATASGIFTTIGLLLLILGLIEIGQSPEKSEKAKAHSA